MWKGASKMQLLVYIKLDAPFTLPINYNHILQSVIYKALSYSADISEFVHNIGFSYGERQYKMFQFSQLKGRYNINQKKITFSEYISFEIRSPENRLIQLLYTSFLEHGILFGEKHYKNVGLELRDYTVEECELQIKMKTPITVYSMDAESKSVYFYAPDEEFFYKKINDNFCRKYLAYCGITPVTAIKIQSIQVSTQDKFVTKYKQSYITGWYGIYKLAGERKYLDFLYQVGLGGKNSQGFGMFELL